MLPRPRTMLRMFLDIKPCPEFATSTSHSSAGSHWISNTTLYAPDLVLFFFAIIPSVCSQVVDNSPFDHEFAWPTLATFDLF